MQKGDNGVKKGKMLQTVRCNFEGWTKREIKETKLARALQFGVGNMCGAKLKQMMSVKGLKNVPIHPEHVTNTTRIFDPNTAALKGKTVRRPSQRMRVHENWGGHS